MVILHDVIILTNEHSIIFNTIYVHSIILIKFLFMTTALYFSTSII